MHIAGIAGSPRRGGNTEMLLDAVLHGASLRGATHDKIVLNELVIRPCQGCGGCNADGRCVVRDDMALIYRVCERADAVVIASPVYFGTVSAQVKAMIDRFQCAWVAKHLLGRSFLSVKKREGLFVSAQAAVRDDFFACSRKVARSFFATLDITPRGELSVEGVEERGAVAVRNDSLEKAIQLGGELAR